MDDLVTWLRGVLDEDERNWRVVAEQVEVQPMLHGRHLPTAALADITAKRAILDQHGADDRNVEDGIPPTCRTCHEDSLPDTIEPEPLPYPCPTVRLLGWAYSGRAGYRREWAPEKD